MVYISNVKQVILIAVLSAIASVMSNITININVIPITLSTLAFMIIGILFNYKISFFVPLVYILLGIIGIPVFSNMRAGINSILSYSGGFIIGYIPFCVFISLFYNKFENVIYKYFILLSSNIILYIIGTTHYLFVSSSSVVESIKICVIPFFLFDNIKIIFAIIISKKIYKILKKIYI